MGHARALLGLSGAQQVAAAAKVVSEQMSVRETERLVRTVLSPPARRKARGTAGRDADLVRLQEDLAETLGAKVRIDASGKGAGRVVIAYASLEQLDGILVRLRRK